MNRHLCHWQKMKQGHCHQKSRRQCSQSKLSCGMGQIYISQRKKQIATQMRVELQHRSMGAYCLSFSSDKILCRIAKALTEGLQHASWRLGIEIQTA
jgi:hypothetical protein